MPRQHCWPDTRRFARGCMLVEAGVWSGKSTCRSPTFALPIKTQFGGKAEASDCAGGGPLKAQNEVALPFPPIEIVLGARGARVAEITLD